MPLFDPIKDEIDISGVEDTVEQNQQLPDEVNLEEQNTETPVEGVENTEPDTAAEQSPADTAPPEVPDSSLTTEPPAQPELTQPPVELELSDDKVFTYLSEKLGKEVKSLEDLKPAEQSDPLAGDPELQAIAEWRERTGRPVADYFKFQKDYENMDAIDAVRENLQLKYPDFSPEEIELELQDYTPDPDMDTELEIAKKNLRLKKDAVIAKQELSKYKSTLNVADSARLTKEQQEAISFYQQYQQKSQSSQDAVRQYKDGVTSEAAKIKSIPLDLTEGLSIDLVLTDQDSKEIPKQIMETPHWYNEDGSYNTSAIVKDAIKMRHFDKAVKLAFEQGVASGKEQEDITERNVNFNSRPPLPGGSEEIVVEGADGFNTGPKMTFGRKR